LVENIIEECLHTIDSHDNTDTDVSDLESDFAPSDPLSGNSIGMFNLDSSGQLSDQIFVGLMLLVYLKMKFAKPRSSEFAPDTLMLPSSILMSALNNNICRFCQKL
jgi:hypothetical protein